MLEETYHLTYCKESRRPSFGVMHNTDILLHNIISKLNMWMRMIVGTRRMIGRSSVFLVKLVVLSYATIIMV
jgi:hypothetical protein